jgi:hypothetical protein
MVRVKELLLADLRFLIGAAAADSSFCMQDSEYGCKPIYKIIAELTTLSGLFAV